MAAAPGARTDVEATMAAGGVDGAGFGVRAIAQIIDQLAHLAVWFAGSLAIGLALGVYASMREQDVEALTKAVTETRWTDYVTSTLGYVLYHAVMERMHGATVGKRLLGLTVVSEELSAITMRAAFGRSVALLVDGLIFGAVAYSAMKPPLYQRHGDRWYGTIVTKMSRLAGRGPSRSGFGEALLVGFLADGACCVVSALIKLA